MTKIIGGSSCRKIAYDLSVYLKIDYIDATVARFADQELRIELPCYLYEEDAIIVQSTCKPANDYLMELLLLIDAAKRAMNRKVIAVIPYFGYSRQDKLSRKWEPISAKLVATMLEAVGVNHIVTLDLHSKQVEGFFNIDIQNIDPVPLFASFIEKSYDMVVVSPDTGGLTRARKLADILQSDLAVINKTRKEHNSCEMDNIIGNVAGKTCVIIDDIVDTGNTLCNAAVLLGKHGAKNIQVVVTHAVLSGNAIQELSQSPIRSIITTNTIPQKLNRNIFQVIDVVPVIGQAVKNLMK